jgi:heme exporter protein D
MNACHYIWGAYGVTFLILVAMAIVTKNIEIAANK